MSTLTALREDDDKRYTMRLTLIREGRPKYWTFHCPFCTTKVCELDGAMVHMTDLSPEMANSPVVRIRCLGGKKWCRMWYEIQLFN